MTNKATHYVIDNELSGGNTTVEREHVTSPLNGGEDFFITGPTSVVRIDGKRYRLADRRAEVGEQIMNKRSGDVAEVTAVKEERACTRCFEDIDGDEVYGMAHGYYYVLLPMNNEHTETTPQGDAQTLIANLASEVARLTRKVTELEEQVDSNRKDIIKQAEEFAELNGLVEALETQEYTLSEESADKVAEHLLTEVLMRERRFK